MKRSWSPCEVLDSSSSVLQSWRCTVTCCPCTKNMVGQYTQLPKLLDSGNAACIQMWSVWNMLLRHARVNQMWSTEITTQAALPQRHCRQEGPCMTTVFLASSGTAKGITDTAMKSCHQNKHQSKHIVVSISTFSKASSADGAPHSTKAPRADLQMLQNSFAANLWHFNFYHHNFIFPFFKCLYCSSKRQPNIQKWTQSVRNQNKQPLNNCYG